MNALATLIKWVAIAGLTGLTTGCATSGTPGDPLEGFNRAVFGFNEGFDQAIVKPVAKGYTAVVPEPGRNCVSLFVRPALCLRLPPDSQSPATPLWFGYLFPLPGKKRTSTSK